MPLIISCQTTAKTVYIVPDIDFPDYPSPFGFTTYDPKTDEVRMSLDYYEKLLNYKLKVDEAEKIYKAAKEIYEENNSKE